jgi:hypothetical protein
MGRTSYVMHRHKGEEHFQVPHIGSQNVNQSTCSRQSSRIRADHEAKPLSFVRTSQRNKTILIYAILLGTYGMASTTIRY